MKKMMVAVVAVLSSITAAAQAQGPASPAGQPYYPPPAAAPAAPPVAAQPPMAPQSYPPLYTNPAPLPTVESPKAVADGFMFQPRMETPVSLTGMVLGAPGFIAGFRSGNFTGGLGFGLVRGSFTTSDSSVSSGVSTANTTSEDKTTYTAFQILPTVLFDVWQSADGRARFNLLGAIGYSRASATITSEETRTGQPAMSSEDKASLDFIPIRLGVGGDYFLHPNFGLGAEFGFQSLFLVGTSSESETRDYSANFSATYGAIRATMIVGK